MAVAVCSRSEEVVIVELVMGEWEGDPPQAGSRWQVRVGKQMWQDGGQKLKEA